MYAEPNPKTKKALRELVLAAQAQGEPGIACFQPGPFGPTVKNGDHTCEGPHFPEPHRWYARVRVQDGYIVRVLT